MAMKDNGNLKDDRQHGFATSCGGRKAFFSLLTFLAVLNTAHAERFPIGDPATSKSYLEMTQVFSANLNSGYNTVRYNVKNETSGTLRFTLESKSSVRLGSDDQLLQSTQSFTAPPTQTTTSTLLLPVLAIGSQSGVHGYGAARAEMSVTISGACYGYLGIKNGLDAGQPAAAFSILLTANDVARFNRLRPSSRGSNEEFATEFDPTQLPADWRAFAGLDYLSMSGQEWLTVAPEVRAAIFQWVESGGVLTVYTAGENERSTLQFPSPGPTHGCGVLRDFKWDLKSLDNPHLQSEYPVNLQNNTPAPHPQLQNLRQTGTPTHRPYNERYYYGNDPDPEAAFKTRWELLSHAMGERSFSMWQVGLILVLFGILVGPVNLFVFAKPGRRHRLFWTTPLISLAASLLLILYILFSDGTGGQGVRTTIAYVNPTAATVNLRQEQISRTGLLFGGSFTLEEPAVVAPVVLLDSRWTRLKASYNRGNPQQFSLRDTTWAGDWFQSRSEQAQSIQMVRSSRGRLELASAAGAPPELRSNFAYPLEMVFYADDKGIWKSTGELQTGGMVKMQKSDAKEFQMALSKHLFANHPSLTEMQKRLLPGHFYALTTHPSAEMITSLKAVAWQENHTLVWGPVVASP